jgi:hypothetical protein
MMIALMSMPPCSKPSIFPYFNCVMEVLVEIYGGDRAPPCQDVMKLLMAARVPLFFYSLVQVGFAFWVTPHQICSLGPHKYCLVRRNGPDGGWYGYPIQSRMIVPLVVKVPRFVVIWASFLRRNSKLVYLSTSKHCLVYR